MLDPARVEAAVAVVELAVQRGELPAAETILVAR